MARGGCPVCRSPHRAELERRLQDKEPLRSISAWALEQGQRIAISSLSEHSRFCQGVPSAWAKETLPPPAETISLPEPREVLPAVQALEHYETEASRLYDTIVQKVLQGAPLSPGYALIFAAAMKERRQCAQARHVLVHGRKVTVQGHLNTRPDLKSLSTEELKARLSQLDQEQPEGGDVVH